MPIIDVLLFPLPLPSVLRSLTIPFLLLIEIGEEGSGEARIGLNYNGL